MPLWARRCRVDCAAALRASAAVAVRWSWRPRCDRCRRCRCCCALELAAPVRSLPPPRRLLQLSVDRLPVAATCAGASGAGFRCVLEPAEEAAAFGAPSSSQCGPAVAVVVAAAVRGSRGARCRGCCHRRRCGQRAPLPHWWRLLPFPKPAFAGARTVARASDGRRPPWELVGVAGAVCRRADARRHCLALLFPCAPPRRGSHVGLGVGAVRPVPPPRQTASQKTRRPLSPLCQGPLTSHLQPGAMARPTVLPGSKLALAVA